jgi:CBS-domain-containing membrane protein
MILQKHKIEKLPMIDEAGKLIGLITSRILPRQRPAPIRAKMKKAG